jgi:hypothetical protein
MVTNKSAMAVDSTDFVDSKVAAILTAKASNRLESLADET